MGLGEFQIKAEETKARTVFLKPFLPRKAAMFITWLNTQLAGGSSPAILDKQEVFYYYCRRAANSPPGTECLCLSNFCVEIPTPTVMTSGAGASGGRLGHEGGASWTRPGPLEEGPQRALILFLPREDTRRRRRPAPRKRAPIRTRPHGHPDLERPASREARNTFLMFIRHPVDAPLSQ